MTATRPRRHLHTRPPCDRRGNPRKCRVAAGPARQSVALAKIDAEGQEHNCLLGLGELPWSLRPSMLDVGVRNAARARSKVLLMRTRCGRRVAAAGAHGRVAAAGAHRRHTTVWPLQVHKCFPHQNVLLMYKMGYSRFKIVDQARIRHVPATACHG